MLCEIYPFVTANGATSDPLSASQLSPLAGTGVGALGTDVGALGTDVGALGTDVGALGTDVGALGTDVGALGTDVDALGTGVAATWVGTGDAVAVPVTEIGVAVGAVLPELLSRS